MARAQKITGPAFFIGKEGDGIISFGSGQPDLPPPKEIFRDLENPRLFKYGLIQGDKKLREALAGEYPRPLAGGAVQTKSCFAALTIILIRRSRSSRG